ncbi:membrane protein [Rugosimonospora acidiphila]|uniref:Membrane protein n=1 Tax=Rugosimonospora acidiphila TaxID=556531 RepID=A0ABP9SUX6_9ACTN
MSVTVAPRRPGTVRRRAVRVLVAGALVAAVAGPAGTSHPGMSPVMLPLPGAGDASRAVGGGVSGGTPVPCDPDALIAAIDQANADGGATLALARRCVYSLAADAGNQFGLPVISQPITIAGNGATIERAAAAPAFGLFDVAFGGDLTVRDLTLTGGNNTDSPPQGGAISMESGARVTVIHCALTHNRSAQRGGAILNLDGVLRVTDSTLTDNSTGNLGGAIYSTADLTVENSTLSGNSAAIGGAILNFGVANLTNTTLRGNHATTEGGAIAAQLTSTSTTLDHSTVEGNTSATGGGIFSSVLVTLNQSTVSGNTASGDGGGILNEGTLVFVDSRITGNTAGGDGGGLRNTDVRANAIVRDSGVDANRATGAGSAAGGVANSGGSLSLQGAQVTGNSSTTPPGGVSTDDPTVTVDSGTVIAANRPTNCAGSPVAVPNCFG